MVSVCRELRSSLDWEFWLRVSYQIVVKGQLGLQSCEALTGAGDCNSSQVAHSHGWQDDVGHWREGGLFPPLRALSMEHLKYGN